jgi:uncharacterized protein (TIGR02611 family)
MRAKTISVMRKLVVGIVGFPLLLLGIVLIPLPGPGLIISFLALLILSIEFKWTRRYLNRIKHEFRQILARAREKQAKMKT